ncbi:MAG: amino acid--tRNA ligase-related protein, partial [Candidatus Tectomicrobia bacterium]
MNDFWQPSCSLDALRARDELLRTLREFFATREVLEVQTATLASHTVTDINIESLQVQDDSFLQTSPEYQLKRLLAAGAPSIYQLGPVFRAGETGRLHNPEFTLLEWYRLGFDDVMLMSEVAELVDLVLGPQPVRLLPYRELV